MRTPLFLLCFIGFLYNSMAQEIQVLSQENKLPVSGVALFNTERTKSAITDFDGYVDISKFSEEERITFQHLTHEILITNRAAIKATGNTVILNSDASQLDEIILSVSKFGQRRSDIPQKIVSVTSEDVLFRNPQTAADLLQSSGQVYVQKSQLGGGSPLIRGFSTNRLLITVDGIRFNTAIFRGGNVQNVISIDPFTVDRTEVILGPGSVVYGSDAVGGVMNFYTKKPKFSFEDGLDVSGNVLGRYATANNEKTGHIDINLGMKQWAFLTSVSYSDFDDLRMGSNGPDDYLRNVYAETIDGVDTEVVNPDPEIQRSTGYDQINFMQKARYNPNEKWDFNLGLFYTTTSDYSRYDRLIRTRDGNLRSAEWYYGPQEWLSGNLQITSAAVNNNSFYDESMMTLSYQRSKESRNDRDFGEVELFETNETVNAYSSGLDFTKKIAPKSTIFYGLEYVYNKVGSEGKVTDISTGNSQLAASRYPDGSTWQSMAAYTSLQSKFSETVSFQGGLRYNHVLVNEDFTENNQFFELPFSDANINTGALTGSAGITWQASKILGWKANFGTAFRAPNVDDVGKIFDSEPGSVVVPNPDLEAEYAYNGDIGATFNFDNTVKFEMSAYYTVLKDALVRRDFSLNGETEILYQGELSTVQAIQNAGSAEVYGFEVGAEANFSEFLQLTAQYNITDGFTDEEGDRLPIRHAAPQFGNAHLMYTKTKWKLDGFVQFNGKFDFEDLAPSQQNSSFLYALDENGDPYSPSWYTFNLAGQYQITKDLRLTATLENITDQRYRPYSSGIAAAGRNLIMAASYSF